jgi:hypothetical protein
MVQEDKAEDKVADKEVDRMADILLFQYRKIDMGHMDHMDHIDHMDFDNKPGYSLFYSISF